jgi:hypothetical protein
MPVAATKRFLPITITLPVIPMSDRDIYWTLATACQYGGSFYQALALAGLKADPSNKRRIIDAFPEMVATYGTASKLHQGLRSGAAA